MTDEAWMQEPIRLHHENGNTNKALREGRFDAELRELGLEPTKETYRARLAALGESDQAISAKKPNWFAKAFLGKPDGNGENRRPKPCRYCKPVPPPPGPQPTPLPIAGSSGEFCWGYLERCDRRGNCYAHFRPVNYAHCDLIRRQLLDAQSRADAAEMNKVAECVSDPLGADCAHDVSSAQGAEYEVVNLRKQYKMCLMAASSVADLQGVWADPLP